MTVHLPPQAEHVVWTLHYQSLGAYLPGDNWQGTHLPVVGEAQFVLCLCKHLTCGWEESHGNPNRYQRLSGFWHSASFVSSLFLLEGHSQINTAALGVKGLAANTGGAFLLGNTICQMVRNPLKKGAYGRGLSGGQPYTFFFF